MTNHPTPHPAPDVSVVMANWNGAAFLPEAVASVIAQEGVTLELLIADDGSTDDSQAVIGRLAGADTRIVVVPRGRRGGPAAARNRALAVARGRWVAIVDSDDVILAGRLARLVSAAETMGADVAADDLAYFGEPATHGRTLIDGRAGPEPVVLSAEAFLQGHIPRYRRPAWGYLKPVIRRSALGALRYDESLRIGEDSDLLLRLLLGGRRLVVVPEPLYGYRRHAGSVSHRWAPEIVSRIAAHQRAMLAEYPGLPPALRVLMRERLAGLERRVAFEELVVALKHGAGGDAIAVLARRPALVWQLGEAAVQGFARRLGALLPSGTA